jgi:hypothetical protein
MDNGLGIAFFLSKHNVDYATIPSIGAKMKVNLKTIRTQDRRLAPITNVAVTLFKHGDVKVRTLGTRVTPKRDSRFQAGS